MDRFLRITGFVPQNLLKQDFEKFYISLIIGLIIFAFGGPTEIKKKKAKTKVNLRKSFCAL